MFPVLLLSMLSVRSAGGAVDRRDAFRPDAFRRARRAGAVKNAEGIAKRRRPEATVLNGSEHHVSRLPKGSDQLEQFASAFSLISLARPFSKRKYPHSGAIKENLRNTNRPNVVTAVAHSNGPSDPSCSTGMPTPADRRAKASAEGRRGGAAPYPRPGAEQVQADAYASAKSRT